MDSVFNVDFLTLSVGPLKIYAASHCNVNININDKKVQITKRLANILIW